jgi:hypothetical protein
MHNRYKGLCPHCGMWVIPGDGDVRKVDGKWVAAHSFCWDLMRPEEIGAGLAPSPDRDGMAGERN